jgi:hypothetical protein
MQWVEIKEESDIFQKKIVLAYNKRLIIATDAVIGLFILLVFTRTSILAEISKKFQSPTDTPDFFYSPYFAAYVLIFVFAIANWMTFSSKVYLTKKLSDNSIVLQKQSLSLGEPIVYQMSEKPFLKLKGVSFLDSFSIAIISDKKRNLLHPKDSRSSRDGWGFSKNDAEKIARVLDIPISDKIAGVLESFDYYGG